MAANNIQAFLDLLSVYVESVEEEEELFTKLDSLQFDFSIIYGTCAIHFVSLVGNLPVVNYLISHQHVNNILRCDSNGCSALHMAAAGGHTSVFNALLEALQGDGRESYINTTRNNLTGALPIHYAVGQSQIDMARYLLDNGADINSTDFSGAAPFHFAARCGSIAALEFVFKRQSGDVNHSNQAGLTALHYAAWNGKLKAIQWLLEKGATVESCDKVEGATPLHWAAMGGKKEALEMLMRAKPRAVLLKNKRNQNVFEVAEEYENASGIASEALVKDLVKVLIEIRSEDPEAIPQNFLAKYVIGYGDGPMISDLRHSFINLARQRKWRGFSEELVQDIDGSGIVEWAARTGNKGSIDLVMELLCKNATEPDVLKEKLYAGLHCGLLHGKIEFVKALADHKDFKGKISMVLVLKGLRKFLVDKNSFASLSAKDLKLFCKRDEVNLIIKNDVPLAFWLFHGNREDIVRFISDQGLWGALVNEQGPDTRRTALHWATILKKHDIVKRLCEIKECKSILNDFLGNYPHEYRATQEIQMELAARKDVQAYLYRARQLFVDALNAILVCAALIAAISFQGFLQPPRGYNRSYMDVENQSIKSFIWFNGMSFFFAMTSALSAVAGVLPTEDIYSHEELNIVVASLYDAARLLVLSIGCALLAFGAAGHSVIPQKHERTGFNIVLSVGGAVSLLVLVVLLAKLLKLTKFYISRLPSMLEWPVERFLGLICSRYRNATLSAAVGEMSERDEVSTVYEVGPDYPEMPWDDGLDKLSSTLPARQTLLIQMQQDHHQ